MLVLDDRWKHIKKSVRFRTLTISCGQEKTNQKRYNVGENILLRFDGDKNGHFRKNVIALVWNIVAAVNPPKMLITTPVIWLQIEFLMLRVVHSFIYNIKNINLIALDIYPSFLPFTSVLRHSFYKSCSIEYVTVTDVISKIHKIPQNPDYKRMQTKFQYCKNPPVRNYIFVFWISRWQFLN